jgi:TRAP-type mannitol/chloroaromatic compound transport system permease small subunit
MIEKIIQKVGDFCSWLSFALVILITLDVFLRYVFNFSSASLYELEWHFFAIIFLLGSSITLQKDEHVRVDIFYRGSSSAYKNNVNFILSFFLLLPVCFVIGFYSLELIEMSWKIREVSTEAGGLDYVYIQKTLIILFPLTMILTFVYQLIHKKWK